MQFAVGDLGRGHGDAELVALGAGDEVGQVLGGERHEAGADGFPGGEMGEVGAELTVGRRAPYPVAAGAGGRQAATGGESPLPRRVRHCQRDHDPGQFGAVTRWPCLKRRNPRNDSVTENPDPG